jgi:uncharacterized membrane protein
MRRTISTTLAILATASTATLAAPNYKYVVGNIEVTDLGTLGGDSSSAYGINDLDDIVGDSKAPDGKQHAFIYLSSLGQMLSIHDGTPSWSAASAYAINNSQIVVGGYRDANTGFLNPFYYYPGIWLEPSPTNASVPLMLTWEASAYAINSSDRIVGWAGRHAQPGDPPVPNTQGACHDELPVYWQNAGAYPAGLFCLTDPDGDGFVEGAVKANDINDSNNIVGVDGKTSTHSMFLFKNGVRYSVPAPAGFPVVDQSGKTLHGTANGISNKNWVVGSFPYYVATSYQERAYFWDGVAAQSEALGVMPGGTFSVARKVNESKIVVGRGNRTSGSSNVESGFIWHPDFGMHPLPSRYLTGTLSSLRPTNCSAYAINELESGLVKAVGWCLTNSGKRRAVRWDITINTVQIPTITP